MIKLMLNFLFFVLLFSYNNMYSQKCEEYKITKIDSTSSFYLIYTRKGWCKTLFLSVKGNHEILTKDKKKVILKNKYTLCPVDNVINEGKQFNGKIVHNVSIGGKKIRGKRKKFDIYFSDNLVGLYYIENGESSQLEES